MKITSSKGKKGISNESKNTARPLKNSKNLLKSKASTLLKSKAKEAKTMMLKRKSLHTYRLKSLKKSFMTIKKSLILST